MSHLKYSLTTGHLLFGSGGHLVHTCGCTWPNPITDTVKLSGTVKIGCLSGVQTSVTDYAMTVYGGYPPTWALAGSPIYDDDEQIIFEIQGGDGTSCLWTLQALNTITGELLRWTKPVGTDVLGDYTFDAAGSNVLCATGIPATVTVTTP